MQDAYGIPRITTAQMEDFVGIIRRLFRGEVIMGHDGPAGSWPVLHLDATLDEYVPLGIWAFFGPETLKLGGRCFDEVVLHTYFTDETTTRCVKTVKDAAEQAGRDPDAVKVWSCFATVGDWVPEDKPPHEDPSAAGTYLQGYGDLLVRTNGWDHDVLDRFLADPVIAGGARPRRGGHARAAPARRHPHPRGVAGGQRHRLHRAVPRRHPGPVRPSAATA